MTIAYQYQILMMLRKYQTFLNVSVTLTFDTPFISLYVCDF